MTDTSKIFLGQRFTYNDMFNINAHQFGHCLGLNHVGDNHPKHDIMDHTYDHPIGDPSTHRHCVSNLNLEALEVVFAPDWKQPPTGGASVSVDNHEQYCDV